nr:hypothetical protein pPsy0479a_00121 [Pseudomonas syringae]
MAVNLFNQRVYVFSEIMPLRCAEFTLWANWLILLLVLL